MRLEIKSTDRIGISQEILAIFARHSWDLRAIEVITGYTYLHVDKLPVSIDEVIASLAAIAGIVHCKEVELLPTERREHHLQTLLDKIPDPILDLDEQGIIIGANKAVHRMLFSKFTRLEGQSIEAILDQCAQNFLVDKPATLTVSVLGQPYLADVGPVLSENGVTGALITLRSMDTVGRQISLIQSRNEDEIDNIIGQSTKIKLVKEQTLRYADLDLPVLVSGETGTGKELIARALHSASARAAAPFLAINCAALPEHLLESELFGYAPGAFTGAQRGGKPGLFELASGGTIFLDEIAEMSVYLQAKLLRFLQDFRFRRVGGTVELTANVRIISASHQNLTELIEKKLFREDLFYRLNVLSLELPPLRERLDDIPLLTHYFIKNSALQVSQKKPAVSEEAILTLQRYHWPGNIRQLQNILFRVIALNTSATILPSDLTDILSQSNGVAENSLWPSESIIYDRLHDISWEEAQQQFEINLLKKMYPLFPTTRKLAQRLKVSHNKIAMKLRQYQIK